jgi:hypothetical protein
MNSRITILSLVLVSVFVWGGCASTLHVYRGVPKQVISDTKPVYVTNPELAEECIILRGSRIYQISERPENANRLTLLPLRKYGRCGNPLMLSIVTFGLIPGYLPGALDFSYKLETDEGTILFTHRLPVYERFSVWERLIHQDRSAVLSDALRHSERTAPKSPEPTTPSVTPAAASSAEATEARSAPVAPPPGIAGR